ncbi:hypothetical protein BX666DRAFT_2027583 [Dichotomocladium elegans]|nr:hypothetical protein BX666DRAFT_2027583 [Dichotomocladium elegans]
MLPTLLEFLRHIQLDQYHHDFCTAGATDNDLPQLVAFDDAELNDIISAVHMLPFHAIKFKKALRDLRVRPSIGAQNEHHALPVLPSLQHMLGTVEDPFFSWSGFSNSSNKDLSSREVVISHAKIYGKRSTRSLTSYEEAINAAAVQLALQDPSLVVNKGKLFERAKHALLANGYQYKRGKSRSKLTRQLPYHHPQTKRNTEWPKIKRRSDALQKSVERLQKIDVLQNRVGVLAASSDPEAISETKELMKELSKLKAKERKHQWYERRKAERSDSGFSECGSSEETEEGWSND